jgi:HEAT repeat protein
MNPKLLLKVFPVVMLMVVQVVGMGGVARSQVPIPALQIQDLSPSPEELKALNAARDSIPDLIKLLTHPNQFVQHLAASTLANKEASALPSIMPLLNHENPLLRSNAAYILGMMGESGVFRDNIFRGKISPTVREAAQSLIPILISLLRDSDAAVRSKATYALQTIDEPTTKSALIPLLKDPDEMIRLEAANKLSGMEEQDTHAIPALLSLLKSQRPEVRLEAIQSLGSKLQFKFSCTSETESSIMPSLVSILPSLVSMLDDPNVEVQSRTAATLGNIGEPAKSAIPKLIPILKHPDRLNRLFAAYALGEMGKSARSAIPQLIPLLKDSDADVRWNASDALINIGHLKGNRYSLRPAEPGCPAEPPRPVQL